VQACQLRRGQIGRTDGSACRPASYGVHRSAERTVVRAGLPGYGVHRSAERTVVGADLPGYGVADGLADAEPGADALAEAEPDACALRLADGGSLGMGGGK
jgi:hypothetical protein